MATPLDITTDADDEGESADAPKLDPLKICTLKNICDKLDDDYLSQLGQELYDEYDEDLRSRVDWDRRMAEAMKFAMQIAENKSFPWPGASNVKFPLITIAAMQYHARAYPALVQPDDIVRYKVYGDDPSGQKNAVGRSIASHMTWQLTEEDAEWEEQQDRALLVQPILGCVFKKTFFDFERKRNRSICVLPKDIVISYFASSIETAERISHTFEMSRNKVHYRKVMGYFRDIELPDPQPNSSPQSMQEQVKLRAQGVTMPISDPQQPYKLVEMQCGLDLDNDGYREPYVVTIDQDTKTVLRIVARYAEPDIKYTDDKKKKIACIYGDNHYTKYSFIPSPDGGIYDLGFGILLSPLTRSIDTLINQLIDSGTLANTAGGFLGRGIKMRGGQFMFKPFEWKPIDTVGDDIGKNVFPLPVRAPSDVLFKLLGFLVEYGERLCSATDPNVGIAPGQNTPAETSRAMGEAGLKILSAIFKRTWRGMREEFRILYRLNRIFLPYMAPNPFGITDTAYMLDPIGIRPSADPLIMSDGMRAQQAELAFKIAATPGLGGNPRNAAIRVLQAWKVSDIESILPDPKGPNAVQQGPDPKMVEAQAKALKAQTDHTSKMLRAREGLSKLMQELEVNRAKIDLMLAQAQLATAQAKGIPTGHMIAAIEADIGARKVHADLLSQAAKTLVDLLKETGDGGGDQSGGIPALAAGPGDAAGAGLPALPAQPVDGGMGQ